jgi:hypothetical protein
MNDFAFVAIMLAFFVLLGLFVVACDRIIGPDEQALAGPVRDMDKGGDEDRAAA